MQNTATSDGRRLRGDESRRAVLRLAVDQASLTGLDGLTIGGLASELGVSKSNVATLFGSKLDLQLATIDAARTVFIDTVITPALARPRGLQRLIALIELWLDYSEGRVFAGGCFFRAVGADASAKDDAARDLLAQIDAEWLAFVTRAVREAEPELPGLAGRTDAAEVLAFEIGSMLEAANSMSLLHRTSRGYALARSAVRDRLVALGAPPDITLSPGPRAPLSEGH
ncbi:TetR/AcrR family transcriptional regulator [Arthrobacter sp. D1-29]